MLSETRRSLPGRFVLGALAAGAALSLSACGQLPLLPPALSGDGADESPSPEASETEPAETTEPAEETEDPIATEEPQEPAGPEDTDVFSVNVGDCINDAASDPDEPVSEVPKVDCEEPHDLEVYDDPDLEDADTFPGEDEVAEMADEVCHDSFEDFVGIAWEDSALEYTTLYPTAEGWEDFDDREVLCLVIDPAGQTEGSLENARF